MRLSQLRPCDRCGGPVGTVFHVVRASLAVVNVGAVNQFLGMHQFFGGRASEALIGNFVSLDEAVVVAGDKDAELMTEYFICSGCYLEPIDLPMLQERAKVRCAASDSEATS